MTDSETKTQPEPTTSTVQKSTEEPKVEKSSIDRILEAVGNLTKTVESVNARLTKMEEDEVEKEKAMEKPTDLPLKPATTDEEDIGAKTLSPDKYQSYSRQAGIDDASPKDPSKTDEADVRMEQKTSRTTTPRPPNAVAKSVNEREANPILKAFRELGYAGAEQISKDIRKGKYHTEYTSYGDQFGGGL